MRARSIRGHNLSANLSAVALLFSFPMGHASAADATDCNKNGQDDAREVSTGARPDCNQNGFPEECDVQPGLTFSADLDELLLPRDPEAVQALELDGKPGLDLLITNGEVSNATFLFNQLNLVFEPCRRQITRRRTSRAMASRQRT
jgi:hypothetical protein